MMKSIKVHPKKRGRPATGKDPLVSARIPKDLMAQILSWALANGASRSETVRRLIELGLTVKPSVKPSNKAERASRARDLAKTVVDKISDPTANPLLRNERRKMLIKGPSEFRETRVDLPKRKS